MRARNKKKRPWKGVQPRKQKFREGINLPSDNRFNQIMIEESHHKYQFNTLKTDFFRLLKKNVTALLCAYIPT